MAIFDKIFRQKRQPDQSASSIDLKLVIAVDEFSNHNEDTRMRIIMACGDTGDKKYFPILEYSIQHDRDQGVRFAALKRIQLFKENRDEAISILSEMQKKGEGKKYEPYFSMALSSLGIITLKEFEDKLHGNIPW